MGGPSFKLVYRFSGVDARIKIEVRNNFGKTLKSCVCIIIVSWDLALAEYYYACICFKFGHFKKTSGNPLSLVFAECLG